MKAATYSNSGLSFSVGMDSFRAFVRSWSSRRSFSGVFREEELGFGVEDGGEGGDAGVVVEGGVLG